MNIWLIFGGISLFLAGVYLMLACWPFRKDRNTFTNIQINDIQSGEDYPRKGR